MITSAIKIKGGRTGLWVILDKSVPFATIEQELKEKLNRHGTFFPEGTSIHVVANGFGEAARQRLMEMFGERDITVNFEEAEPSKMIAQKNAKEQMLRQQQNGATKGYDPIQPEKSKPAEEKMLVIHRTVRGGEEIISDGSILICGNVHPGANIIAGGNIDIRGRCQGVVHAGVNGDTSAIIIADHMQPMQIRIANLIARSPDEVEETDKAEKASIKNGRIVVEPIVR